MKKSYEDVKIAGRPEPGYFTTKLVSRGVKVPAVIWLEDGERDENGELVSDQRLRCIVDGEERDPIDVWETLTPCGEEVFRFLAEDAEWARQFAPHDPKANPRKPVDYARIGHNSAGERVDDLSQAHDLVRGVAEFTRAYIDADTARRAVLHVKRMQVVAKRLEEAWKIAERPHKDAAEKAGKALRSAVANLDMHRADALRCLHAYRLALGPEVKIDTDYGAKAFGRTTKKLVIDLDKLDPFFFRHIPDEARIREALDDGRAVQGARYEDVHSTVVS